MDAICKHCGRTIVQPPGQSHGWLHVSDEGYTGKGRCNPEESGLRYGYNGAPEGQPCEYPCLGAD